MAILPPDYLRRPALNVEWLPPDGECFHAEARSGSGLHAGVIFRAVASDDRVVVAAAARYPEQRYVLSRGQFDFFPVGSHVLAAFGLQQTEVAGD